MKRGDLHIKKDAIKDEHMSPQKKLNQELVECTRNSNESKNKDISRKEIRKTI